MAGYVECMVKGDRRAALDVSMIAGVITSPSLSLWDNHDPDRPLSILLRPGETIEVYGISPAILLAKIREAKEWLKADARQPDPKGIKVIFLDESQNG